MILTGENSRTRRKTCPIRPLRPPQIPTWIDPGANPGLRGEVHTLKSAFRYVLDKQISIQAQHCFFAVTMLC
jgi:hypothetical protein